MQYDDDDDDDDDDESLPHNGSETSRAAAQDAAAGAGTLREQVYTITFERGDEGCTCDEAEQITGRTHQSVSARFNDLLRQGRIKDSGRVRKTRSKSMATVYVVTGRQVIMTKRLDWRRVTLSKLIHSFGMTGFELQREGLYWQLKLPGVPEQAYASYEDAMQALGLFVIDA